MRFEKKIMTYSSIEIDRTDFCMIQVKQVYRKVETFSNHRKITDCMN